MAKIQKNQAGLAHLVLIVLVVAVLAVIGLVGMRVMKKNKDTNSSASITGTAVKEDKQVEKACNDQLHDKNLCKFASHYSLDKVSYKATINSTSSDGNSLTTMEVDGKDNSSMVISQGGKEASAFIYLNGASYIKDENDGSWTKYPASNTQDLKDSEPTKDIKIDTNDFTEKNTLTYKALGKEACGSLNCFKYQIVDSTSPKSQQFFWFDDKNYMMQRWSNKDDSGSMDMTFSYQSITIKEPSPVHEFSASNSADLNAAIQAAQQASAAGDDSEQ